ncbi:MAG: E2 ligase fold family C protein, partial [Gammaproteobacteria bacterium]|nr:E2 ligase fold family C protein [Gammaproteobacteria bacterium]
MAVADYFKRNVLAISQLISGLDETNLEQKLGQTSILITIGRDVDDQEGRSLLDLLVRLLARLYPTISFRADVKHELSKSAHNLASRINPCIGINGKPNVEIVIGRSKLDPCATTRIFAGSSGWEGVVSTKQPLSCGNSNNPFGPGAGACLVAATLFRKLFLGEDQLIHDLKISVLGNCSTGGSQSELKGSIG